MTNTSLAEQALARRDLIGLCIAALTIQEAVAASGSMQIRNSTMSTNSSEAQALNLKQLAVGPIAASAAVGDISCLRLTLGQGLEAGLTVSELKEVLVQLYAYAGFPRALNALAALMEVLDQRRSRGIQDDAGRDAGPVPTGQALLEAGTANQTRLSGAPVTGPLFDFVPAIDRFLKTHLFGDIFARDNLDWVSRELATVAALSALQGVEAQLDAHVRIGINVGLTAPQLRQFAAHLGGEAQQRIQAALARHATPR